jgi:hypothetical protein
MTFTTREEKTYWVRIYLSGSLPHIEQICRSYCLDVGLCVTIEATRFIYTGGEETGAVIGLINYPRFPSKPQELWETARYLALTLLEKTYQHSVLLMSPDSTEWITQRPQENPQP